MCQPQSYLMSEWQSKSSMGMGMGHNKYVIYMLHTSLETIT